MQGESKTLILIHGLFVEILPGEKIQLTCSIPPSQSKSPAIKDR